MKNEEGKKTFNFFVFKLVRARAIYIIHPLKNFLRLTVIWFFSS